MGDDVDTIIRQGCGLDVHKDNVVGCVRLVDPLGAVHKEVRTFGTTTNELLKLMEWLSAWGGPHCLDSQGRV